MPKIRAITANTWCYRFRHLYATLEGEGRLQFMPEAEDTSIGFLNPGMWFNVLITGIITNIERTFVSVLAIVLSPLLAVLDLVSAFITSLPELRQQYLFSVATIVPLTVFTAIKSLLRLAVYTLLLLFSPFVIAAGALYIAGNNYDKYRCQPSSQKLTDDD